MVFLAARLVELSQAVESREADADSAQEAGALVRMSPIQIGIAAGKAVSLYLSLSPHLPL